MVPLDLFAGLQVRLWGFTAEQEIKYIDAVKERGGTIVSKHTIIGSHLVAFSSKICNDDPVCVQARTKGCIVVNEFWMDDCLDEGRLLDPQIATYNLAHRLEGIDCYPVLRICIVGYSETETIHLKRIGDLIGATCYEKFDEHMISHLICSSPASIQYAQAKRAGIPAVRETWLEECLLEWKVAPLEMHMEFSFEKVSLTRCTWTPHLSGTKNFTTSSCAGSGQKHTVATTGRIRDRSPPPVDRPNPKARRSLQFPLSETIRFSEYLKSVDLTETVRVPEYRRPQTMTNPDVKSALLRALGLLLDKHLEQRSLAGLFSLSDFIISKKSKAMSLEDLPLRKYTADLGDTDRDRFAKACEDAFGGNTKVPRDVSVWLSRIRSGIDGYVLRRHINMLHPGDTYGEFVTLYHAFLKLSQFEKQKFLAHSSLDCYKSWTEYTFRWTVLRQSLSNKELFVKAREEETARMLRLSGASGNMAYEEEKGAYKDDLQGLLHFIRDSFVHPAKEYKIYMLAVMLIEYKNLLADLQEMLYLWGKLPQLKY